MTWTDRYLAVVLRHIPGSKRGDVERELRSSIEDGIEERIGVGEDRVVAERTVLEQLGDPALLAAAYSGQPNYLIGPELFPIFRHYVPRLLAIAVPIAFFVLLGVKLAGGGSPGDAIASAIGGGISVAIQIAFWSAVTFVILDWAPRARQARADIVAAAGRWTLERLPKVIDGRITIAETASEIVTVLVTLGILAFTAGITTTTASGGSIPFLKPSFATLWLPLLLVMIAIRGIDHVRAYNAGRWTRPLAIYHALMHLTFGLLMVMLAQMGEIVNPAFGAAIGWLNIAKGNGPVMMTFSVFIALATGYEIVRIYLRARRAGDAAASQVASTQSA
jgi:hypothetical protein